MFEAAVLIALMLWALIIVIFLGFTSGLFFICLLLLLTLSGAAFALVQLAGLMAGAPIIFYILLLIGFTIFLRAASDPEAIRRHIKSISELTRVNSSHQYPK